jgi:DNA-binding NarL/FixJ family response regulator
LHLAHELFEAAGESALAERARRELELTSPRGRRRTVDATLALTPQEQAVARLASNGSSNRDIAQELFLSPSTVDYHLRKVYRKLTITSRRDLADALQPPVAGAS